MSCIYDRRYDLPLPLSNKIFVSKLLQFLCKPSNISNLFCNYHVNDGTNARRSKARHIAVKGRIHFIQKISKII